MNKLENTAMGIQQVTSVISSAIPPDVQDATLPCVAGLAAFGSSLALSTFTQLKVFGISTGSIRPIPSVVGFVSVALASLASHSAAINTHRIANGNGISSNFFSFGNNINDENAVSFGPFSLSHHSLRVCVLGLVVFKLIGGRFWAVSPSSYTHLGSFARASIPATERYATASQRSTIEALGRRWGCHTCGSRMLGRSNLLPRFHGDHMPPKSVAQEMNRQLWRRLLRKRVSFRFYPQCIECSAAQGSLLAAAISRPKLWLPFARLAGAGGGKQAYFHGLRLRANHFTGAVIAAATVFGASHQEIMNGNEQRFMRLQHKIQGFARPVSEQIKKFVDR